MTRCYHLEVAPVESCDLVQVKSLGKRDYAGINSLQPQGRISRQQFGHPPVVVRGDFYDPQFVIGDSGAEFGSEAGAAASRGICEQVTYFRDRQGWDNQSRPVFPEEPHAPDMIVVGLVERGDERSRVAQDHADSAPPDSSRSGYARYLS